MSSMAAAVAADVAAAAVAADSHKYILCENFRTLQPLCSVCLYFVIEFKSCAVMQ